MYFSDLETFSQNGVNILCHRNLRVDASFSPLPVYLRLFLSSGDIQSNSSYFATALDDWLKPYFVCMRGTNLTLNSLFGREVRGWLGTNTALVVKIVEGRLLLFLTLFKLMFWNSVLALFILFNFRISVLFFLNEDVNQRFTSRNVTAPYNIQTLACTDM